MVFGATGIDAGASRSLRATAGARGADAAPTGAGNAGSGTDWSKVAVIGAAIVGTAAVTGALLLRGRAGNIPTEAAGAARLVEHGSPMSIARSKIIIEGGDHIRTGSALVDDTIAGWTASSVAADGTVGLRGTVRGVADPVYAKLAPDDLLRNNPGMLFGQQVTHPAPPASMDASGWIVDAVDARASTLVLARDQVKTPARVDDVVRLNLDELRSRIEYVRAS